MPATSAAQQTAARMALSAKRGHIPVYKLKKSALQMYKSMSVEQLEHYAHGRIKK